MREKRIKSNDAELDRKEMEWWDANAEIIEKIWALNFDFQKLIRLPYLKKAKHFFITNSANKPLNILEVGCGTGWVGRMIADENLHITGTDFSEAQLKIAKEEAKRFNKEDFCKYQLASSTIVSKDLDGIILHAILHHFTEEELMTFFNELEKMAKGTKVFLYEPVFLNMQHLKPSIKDKVLNKISLKLKKYAIERAKNIGVPNNELQDSIKRIYSEATKFGWYITPKEVPFYQNELYNYLEPLFTIQKEYIVNKTDLSISQALVFNKIETPDFFFSKVLIPLSTYIDKLLVRGNFTSYIGKWDHQFMCFELVRK